MKEAPARAVRRVFGNDVVVSGCWFHYAQALVKRLRKIGLTDSYNSHQDSRTRRRSSVLCWRLPLLPMADIRPAFDDVKSLLMDDSPRKDFLQKLLRYVERQWITKSTVGHSDCPCATTSLVLTMYSGVFIRRSGLASRLHTRTCLHFLRIFSVQPWTARPTFATPVAAWQYGAQRRRPMS